MPRLTAVSAPADVKGPDGPVAGPGYQKPCPREGQHSRPAPGARGDRGGKRMTARRAVFATFSVFFLGMLAAGWLHLGSLTGLSFVAGCALAARYTKRDGLLTAVVTPPLIFMIALVVTQTMSANADTLRRTLTSVAEGIVLTMASVAPWLFSGVMLGIIVAMFCGLPQCVREFRADLRRERAGGAGRHLD